MKAFIVIVLTLTPFGIALYLGTKMPFDDNEFAGQGQTPRPARPKETAPSATKEESDYFNLAAFKELPKNSFEERLALLFEGRFSSPNAKTQLQELISDEIQGLLTKPKSDNLSQRNYLLQLQMISLEHFSNPAKDISTLRNLLIESSIWQKHVEFRNSFELNIQAELQK